jgi:hypothetical protein
VTTFKDRQAPEESTMHPMTRSLAIAGLALAVLAGAARAAESAEVEQQLATQLIDITLEAKPLVNAVYEILSRFELPVQVEWPRQLPEPAGGISFTVEQRPVAEVLARVLEAKGLAYVVRDGRIVVMPARDRRCVERDQAAGRFEALGVMVDKVLPNADRCVSRAMVNQTVYQEGDEVAPGVVIGLIQEDRVIFTFEGYVFEVLSEGRLPRYPEAPGRQPVGPGNGAAIPPGALDQDELAFEQLNLLVTGTIVPEENPEESYAMVNGQDVMVGDSVEGGAQVTRIARGYVVFTFRGREYKVSTYP